MLKDTHEIDVEDRMYILRVQTQIATHTSSSSAATCGRRRRRYSTRSRPSSPAESSRRPQSPSSRLHLLHHLTSRPSISGKLGVGGGAARAQEAHVQVRCLRVLVAHVHERPPRCHDKEHERVRCRARRRCGRATQSSSVQAVRDRDLLQAAVPQRALARSRTSTS